ncbi:MAG: monovalent cation/H(+) antiporter subunit G [Candidatus Thermoplasmatota archaeon]
MIVGIVSWSIVSLGTLFIISAVLALIRFEDPYMKIHAGSKASFGGAVTVFGLLFLEGFTRVTGLLVLVIVFLLITSPIIGHSLGRAAYMDGVNIEGIEKEEFESGGDADAD